MYTQTTLVYPGDDDAELMVADTATGQAQDLPDEDRAVHRTSNLSAGMS